MSRWRLRSDYRPIYPDTYLPRGSDTDARSKALAAGCWAKGAGVLVGYSAAALHNTLWLADHLPAEIAGIAATHAPPGLIIRRDVLAQDEIQLVEGVCVATPARTGLDLGRRLPFQRAVAVLDALCRATDITPDDIATLADRHPGLRGIVSLRSVLRVVDGGAASPQETRTRLLLLQSGLPRPQTRIEVSTPDQATYYLDMGWRQHKVAVEYDGVQRWVDRQQRHHDIDRLEALDRLGWKVIRVSSAHLDAPRELVARVRGALRRACTNGGDMPGFP
ncbi:DUF559 domain-containing protein [Nocardia sp. SYP-A9097]|uniref:endonuclease domain-containing protein n=1 Tax=Nocardia sp. SYP-A9097 TaxID=2663237 RepID=UPI00281499A1|nr:DUF559 domain-containing protein [Nocardia sp. SYP-A9097]